MGELGFLIYSANNRIAFSALVEGSSNTIHFGYRAAHKGFVVCLANRGRDILKSDPVVRFPYFTMEGGGVTESPDPYRQCYY